MADLRLLESGSFRLLEDGTSKRALEVSVTYNETVALAGTVALANSGVGDYLNTLALAGTSAFTESTTADVTDILSLVGTSGLGEGTGHDDTIELDLAATLLFYAIARLISHDGITLDVATTLALLQTTVLAGDTLGLPTQAAFDVSDRSIERDTVSLTATATLGINYEGFTGELVPRFVGPSFKVAGSVSPSFDFQLASLKPSFTLTGGVQ